MSDTNMNVVVKKIIFILLLLMIIGNFSLIFYRLHQWSVKTTRMFISKHDGFVKWERSENAYNKSSTDKGNKIKMEQSNFSFHNNKGYKYNNEHENKDHSKHKTDNQISIVKTGRITDGQIVPTNNDTEKLKTENSISQMKTVSITDNPKDRTTPLKTISRPSNKISIINVNKKTVKTEESSLVKLKRKLGLLKDEKRDRVFFNQIILLNNRSSKEPLLGVRNKTFTEPQNRTQFETTGLLKDEKRDRVFFNQIILLNNRSSKEPLLGVRNKTFTEPQNKTQIETIGLLKDEKRDRVFFNQSILLNNQSSKEPLLGVRNKTFTEPQNKTQFETIGLLKNEKRDRVFFNQSILLNNQSSKEPLLGVRNKTFTELQNKTQFHTTQNDLNYFANGKISKGNAETTKALLPPRNKILGVIKELEAKRNSVRKNPLEILGFKQNTSNNTSNENT